MITTSFADLDSPERLRSILAERGYFSAEAPADRLFDLPPDQIGMMQGAQIVALAGPAPDDNTLVVLWVPRPFLPQEVLRRIRRRLAENTRDGLIFCAQSWQQATLYLLRQEDIPPTGQEPPGADTVPSWKVNFSALRPADRQGLAMLDLSKEDPYDLGKPLLRAFRRAERETIYQNQGLFSNYYLNERLEVDNEAHNAAWRSLAAAMPALRTQIDTALAPPSAAGLDLAQTEALVIRPLLNALGWKHGAKSMNGQADLRVGGMTVAFCHMLPWGSPLDVAPLPGDLLAPPPPSPDMQLIGRLSGQKSVLWGILTNGRTWRLISRQATSTSGVYYEIDVQDLLEVGAPDNHDLRWFAAFFSPTWLHAQSNSPSLLNVVYQSGQFWAEKLGNDLKQAIFKDVFVDLANALAEGVRRTGSEPHLPTVYRATLVLLYRLLFVLYAESRRLLPLSSPGYYPNSLTYMLSTLALKQNALMPKERDFSLQTDDPRLWLKLRALFSAIAEGNATWNVPHYNGGLFANDTSPAHELLASLDGVANDYLTKGLDRLARDEEARGATNEHGALRLIDYMDLDVRRLGSIYEGLLEFQLRRAEEHGEVIDGQLAPVSAKKGRKNTGRLVQVGEVYLATTRQDRKSSGSYYTPDYIVRYIVEQTVGPVLEQRALRFGEAMSRLQEARTQLRRAEQKIDNPRYDLQDYREKRTRVATLETAAIEALLDLKVLDPAMGSGHFLVAAVNYLSDQIIAILQRHPDNPVLPRLAQVRAAIRKNLVEQSISGAIVPDEQLSDRVLLRRMVMKRCIYGVDLNDMAVELAKLSLWLDSFAVGAPLSFLDHHLRWGNSLIGVWEAEKSIAQGSGRWNEFMRALGYMVQVTRLTDSTNAEVAESKTLFEQAQAALRPFREQFNVDLAVHFAPLGDIGRTRQIAYQSAKDRASWDAVTLAKFETAQQEAEKRRFFHWKLEFPEVFVDHERSDWKADGAGGFDAVVGNPPYITTGEIRKFDIKAWLYYKSTYVSASTGKFDIYLLFLEKSWSLAEGVRGLSSYILPNKWLKSDAGRGIRVFLADISAIEKIIDFGSYQVFCDATNSEGPTTYTSICVLSKRKKEALLFSEPRNGSVDEISWTSISYERLRGESWDFQTSFWDRFTKPIFNALTDLISIYVGTSTNADDVFILYVKGERGENFIVQSNASEREFLIEKAICKNFLRGKDIDRYDISNTKVIVLFPYKNANLEGDYLLLGQDEMTTKYPLAWSYLNENRAKLEGREQGKWRGKSNWYCHAYPRAHANINKLKILTPDISIHGSFCIDSEGKYHCLNTVYGITDAKNFDLYFVICVLNSKIFEKFIIENSVDLRGGYYRVTKNFMEAFPLRRIHFTTPAAERTKLVNDVTALAMELVVDQRGQSLGRGANGWPRFDAAAYRATKLGARIATLLPQDAQGNFLAFAEGATGAEEKSDVVHDLLAALATQMIELNKQKQTEIKRFLGWLETQLDITTDKEGRNGIDSLPNKTTLQNYLGDYQKNEAAQPWDSIYAVLYKNRKRFVNDHWVVGDMFRPQLKAAYEQSLATLLPIKEQLARTDALIDQLVYQLYGLTVAEIAIVEGA